jgi:16S rRNA (adenine(1408)-N(1))-methyltransferase
MTLTRVVGKGRTREMDAAELGALRSAVVRTVVDVGTGDGRYAYAIAAAHADWLVIALDALDEPMAETAHKALRKAGKGGQANVVFLRASVEAVPSELGAIADEVHVMLPWGGLLEGIVCGIDAVVAGLASLARTGARFDIVLNGEIWEESPPVRYKGLPVPTPEYVHEVVAPAFARHGLAVEETRYLSASEAQDLATTWARRIGRSHPSPRFVQIKAVRE